MASASNMYITFEIEPIVKLTCMALTCKHNLYHLNEPHCNLKHITISKEAYGCKCEMFEKREDEVQHAST